ncbi:MAG: ABC transporter ATP-binding protein [Gammaproteobacteria bacterium]|nr:ABC transporter ATP-binding protein [Gammaproteobacteria bacterium]
MSDHELIRLENVGIRFRNSRSLLGKTSYEVLKNVSFNIASGESIGILGRNGAGKSTLLKVIAGIIRPDMGRVVNNGVSSALLNLQIGFKQELPGVDNIMLMGILFGLGVSEIREKMDSIIQFSELGDAVCKPVNTYSAGMKARLGFSVAINMSTDILLVDEVLGVGDVEFRKKSTRAMKDMVMSEQTVVLVSHQAQTVKALCERAVWIENGRLKMQGAADEVVEAYESYVMRHPPGDS